MLLREKRNIVTGEIVTGGFLEHKRFEAVDLFRGLGIILMIMGHIDFGTVFSVFIHAFHMPMFFLISGFFIGTGAGYSDTKENGGFWKFIRQKFYRLIIPYFFWGGAQYCIWLLNNYQYTNYSLPVQRLLWINDTGVMGYCGALWFLTALFWAEIIFELIKRCIRNEKVQIILIILVSLFGMTEREWLPVRLPWSLGAACVGVGLLYIGSCARRYYDAYKNESWKSGFFDPEQSLNVFIILIEGLLAVLLIAGNYCLSKQAINMKDGQYGIIPLFPVNAVLATVVGLKLSILILRIQWRPVRYLKRLICRIGECSLLYVVLNQIVIFALRNLIKDRADGNVLKKLFLKLLLLLLTIGIIRFINDCICKTRFRALIGKGSTADFRFASACTAVVCGLVFLVMVPTGCCLDREMKKTAQETVVAAPEVPAGTFDNEILADVLANNLNYLAFDNWNSSVTEYAYCSSSKTDKAEELKAWQKREVRKSQKSFSEWEKEDYLYIANATGSPKENTIRPLAHECFVMASNVFLKLSPSSQEDELTRKSIKLLTSLAKTHKSNSYTGWGGTWQSALWAENIGYAAWLMWDRIAEQDKAFVIRMVEFEADRILKYEIPYYMDPEGKVIYPGDTKGEETAWNSRILALAVCMFPQNAKVRQWEEKLQRLLVSSTAVPNDLTNEKLYDGVPVKKLIAGSNLNEDGTVWNHNLLHLDYMNVIIEGMSDTVLIYGLAGKKVPEAALHNFDLIYDALVNLDLRKYEDTATEHHFYERDRDGNPSDALYMPGNNDWGGKWYASCYLTDTVCDCYQKDKDCAWNLKARHWATVHLDKAHAMTVNSENKKKGAFFQEGENSFVSGETYQMQCMVKAAALQMLYFQK